MTVEFKNFVKFAIEEVKALKNAGKKIDKTVNYIGAQFKDEPQYLSEVTQNNEHFVYSAIDFVLGHYPNLKDGIADYINGESTVDVLTDLITDKDTLLVLTLDAVKETAVKMIDLNGSVTTLEIKQIVRNAGYKADQRNVSDLMNELYVEGFLKFDTVINNGDPHRLYKPGNEYYVFDLSAVNVQDDEVINDSTTVTTDNSDSLDNVIKNSTVVPTVVSSDKAERNQKIKDDFATGNYKVVELATIYGLADRTISRIVYGK
jgi:hypothetical protein